MIGSALECLSDLGLGFSDEKKLLWQIPVCLLKCTVQAPDKFLIAVTPLGIFFSTSKCKVLTKDKVSSSDLFTQWRGSIFDRFSYPGSCVTKDSNMVLKVDMRLSKDWAACAEPKRTRCPLGISLKLKDSVYCAAVQSALWGRVCALEMFVFWVFSLIVVCVIFLVPDGVPGWVVLRLEI